MKMIRRPPATAMLTMAGRLSGLSGAMYTIPGEYSMPPTRAWGGDRPGERELGVGTGHPRGQTQATGEPGPGPDKGNGSREEDYHWL